MRNFLATFCVLFLLTSCRPLTGSKAPDFTLPSLILAESNVSLSEVNRDAAVLLVFWASWCPTCVGEIPEITRIHHELKDKGLKVLAVDVEESRETVKDFALRNPMDYTVLLDESGEVAQKFNVSGLPVAVLLAKGGKIIYYGFSLPPNLEHLIQ